VPKAVGWSLRRRKDGTARAQVMSGATNQRFYRLIRELERRTGYAVVLNTLIDRRAEPIAWRPPTRSTCSSAPTSTT
jgi:predicted NodU family carbamoyl transferase